MIMVDHSMKQGQRQPSIQQSHYFCYFDVSWTPDAIISLIYILIGTIIFIHSIRQYRKTKRAQLMNKTIRSIYFTIFCWAILFVPRMAINQVMYWVGSRQTKSNEIQRLLSIMSKIIFSMAFIAIYIMQTSVLLVAENWVTNLIQFITMRLQQQENYEHPVSNRYPNFMPRQQVYKLLLHYLIPIRYIFTLSIIPFLSSTDPKIQDVSIKIMLVLLLLDDFLVLTILGLELYSLRNNRKVREIIGEVAVAMLTRRYILIISCIGIRTVVQFYFTLTNFMSISKMPGCFYDLKAQVKIKSTIYLVLRGLISNFLSIIAVLKIYHIHQEKENQQSNNKSQQPVQRQSSVNEKLNQNTESRISLQFYKKSLQTDSNVTHS